LIAIIDILSNSRLARYGLGISIVIVALATTKAIATYAIAAYDRTAYDRTACDRIIEGIVEARLEVVLPR
jgi:hypothetical protein